MTQTFAPLPEWRDVDAASFARDIRPLQKPAILRGLVTSWPAAAQARRSPAAMCDYLLGFDAGHPFSVLTAPPEIRGKFFYADDLGKVNFTRARQPLSEALAELLAQGEKPAPDAVSIQSAPMSDHLPNFMQENRLPLLPDSVTPRIWIGNAVTVHSHCDASENIACVLAGRRRITLFPPDQWHNLYVGPLDHTPSGAPVSMASPEAPDLARHPRFAEALAHGWQGELEAGDAIYIPYMWWHHVESLAPFNVLVNYWWNDARADLLSPFSALFLGMGSIRELPEDQRRAWREMFDYYVFGLYDDPGAHLPSEHRGVLGDLTPETLKRIRASVVHALTGQGGQ